MRYSPELQKSRDNTSVDPELIAKLKSYEIFEEWEGPLAEYLIKIEATVDEILDPRVQDAIMEGNEVFAKHHNDNRAARRNLVLHASDNNFNQTI